MSRIPECFDRLRQTGRRALIPYVTAGDPTPSITVDLMHAMVDAGANILELGIPFSDPMADGPAIQEACERALRHGITLADVIDMVQTFRRTDPVTPIVLMGYLNPIEIMGFDVFAERACTAGVDGLLLVDLPPEEGEPLTKRLREVGIDPIFLLAPTSSDERIGKICAMASGFVYYVSLKGVTGATTLDIADVGKHIARIRRYAGDLPVGVGFGIRDAASAAAVARIADAVVVGSVLVSRIKAQAQNPATVPNALAEIIRGMRQAIDTIEALP